MAAGLVESAIAVAEGAGTTVGLGIAVGMATGVGVAAGAVGKAAKLDGGTTAVGKAIATGLATDGLPSSGAQEVSAAIKIIESISARSRIDMEKALKRPDERYDHVAL